jgi:hypothetical protein
MSNLRSPDAGMRGLAALILFAIAGCSESGPETHRVTGQLRLAEQEATFLAGHTVEAALATDPLVRAYGEIQDDGSFALETYRDGVVHKGALGGKYLVRVVLSDDDAERRRQAAQAIDPRFFDFNASGWTIDAPTDEIVSLNLIRR